MATEQPTGIVFNIQRFSVHDGPGIRSIVFFKGCRLRCEWCSNPESQDWRPQLMLLKPNCIYCGHCEPACGNGAISFNPEPSINREKCTTCGSCVDVCYSQALSIAGQQRTVPELITELRKDSVHYRRSGGGITLSGGEALAQPEFCAAMLAACKGEGWHTAVETTAFAPQSVLEQVLPNLDLVLLDIKHADSAKHERHTGKTNELILENAAFIAAFPGVKLTIRVPVIPGFNDQPEEIAAIAAIARSLPGVTNLHLLPYHRMGENKYDHLQYEYKLKGVAPTGPEKIQALKRIVESTGLSCQIGG